MILYKERRVLLDLSEIGFPEIPLLGAYDLSAAAKGLAAHAHPGCLEICHLLRGEQVYCVDGEEYRLKGNDLFITHPGETHSTGGNPEGKGMLYWIQLKIPPPKNSFLGLSRTAARPLLQSLEKIPVRHFRGMQKIQTLFDQAIEKYDAARTDPLARLALATTLTEWLLEVIGQSGKSSKQTLSPDIQRVVDLMKSDLEENRSVNAYAAAVHLSTSRFKAKFKQQLGIPPGEYRLRRKIDAAKARLQTLENSITDIAYEFGFSSSQYFATTFKRFENLSPREYRDQKR